MPCSDQQPRVGRGQPTGHLALLACRHGRLKEAHRLATTTLATVDQHDSGCELVHLDAGLMLAEVSLERNELDAA